MRTKIKLGVMLQGPGCNMHAWRHPSVPVDASVNFDFYLDRALKAEQAGLDFVFIADGLYIHKKSLPHFLNRFEPITILSALASKTSRIGLVATVSTSYSQPFTVARQFASIDMMSGGRAGWNAVTSPLEGSGRNHSRPHPIHAERYEIADEHINVVTSLWDSWDDDAFVRDRESGQYMDPEKMHRLDHKGKFFSVEGPLSVARSRQGHPVVFHAGSSDAGIRVGGRYADAIFTNGGTFEECKRFYQRIKQSAESQGRSPDQLRVFPGIGPIVGETPQEVDRKLHEIRNLMTIEDALDYIGHIFEYDFTPYPLDEAFPEIEMAGKQGFQSTTDQIRQRARALGMTLREVAFEASTRRVHIGTSDGFMGKASDIADEMIRWVEGGAADGFMLGLPVLGFGLDDFVEQVLPELARRGYHAPEPDKTTLRERLHLPYRKSRYK